jgi:hypothetical protein
MLLTLAGLAEKGLPRKLLTLVCKEGFQIFSIRDSVIFDRTRVAVTLCGRNMKSLESRKRNHDLVTDMVMLEIDASHLAQRWGKMGVKNRENGDRGNSSSVLNWLRDYALPDPLQ